MDPREPVARQMSAGTALGEICVKPGTPISTDAAGIDDEVGQFGSGRRQRDEHADDDG